MIMKIDSNVENMRFYVRISYVMFCLYVSITLLSLIIINKYKKRITLSIIALHRESFLYTQNHFLYTEHHRITQRIKNQKCI